MICLADDKLAMEWIGIVRHIIQVHCGATSYLTYEVKNKGINDIKILTVHSIRTCLSLVRNFSFLS